MQIGKLESFPIVSMGREFWGGLREFVERTMLGEGTISAENLDLIHPPGTVEEAVMQIQLAGVPWNSSLQPWVSAAIT
jgi:predicted Rossmann-fold nucleotide-binding protein